MKPRAKDGDWLRAPIPTYRRWVAEFLRFHQDRTGRWIHPQEMGEREVEAFLTHLAVNRRVAQGTQHQALGAIRFLYRHVPVPISLGHVRPGAARELRWQFLFDSSLLRPDRETGRRI